MDTLVPSQEFPVPGPFQVFDGAATTVPWTTQLEIALFCKDRTGSGVCVRVRDVPLTIEIAVPDDYPGWRLDVDDIAEEINASHYKTKRCSRTGCVNCGKNVYLSKLKRLIRTGLPPLAPKNPDDSDSDSDSDEENETDEERMVREELARRDAEIEAAKLAQSDAIQTMCTYPCVEEIERDDAGGMMVDPRETRVERGKSVIGYTRATTRFVVFRVTRIFYVSRVKKFLNEFVLKRAACAPSQWEMSEVHGVQTSGTLAFLYATAGLDEDGISRKATEVTSLGAFGFIEAPPATRRVTEYAMTISTCANEFIIPFKELRIVKEENEPKNCDVRILAFDIECDSKNNVFPDCREDAVLMISGVVGTKRTGVQARLVFTYGKPVAPSRTTTFVVAGGAMLHTSEQWGAMTAAEKSELYENSERQMFRDFFIFFARADPDVITGFNSNTFDWPYVLGRAERIGVLDEIRRGISKIRNYPVYALHVTRRSKQRGTQEMMLFDMPGRLNVDMRPFIISTQFFQQYDLNTCARELLHREKNDMDYADIHPFFYGTSEQRRMLGEYCMMDSELAFELMIKTDAVTIIAEDSKLCGIFVGDRLTRGVQMRILRKLHGYLLPAGYHVPCHFKLDRRPARIPYYVAFKPIFERIARERAVAVALKAATGVSAAAAATTSTSTTTTVGGVRRTVVTPNSATTTQSDQRRLDEFFPRTVAYVKTPGRKMATPVKSSASSASSAPVDVSGEVWDGRWTGPGWSRPNSSSSSSSEIPEPQEDDEEDDDAVGYEGAEVLEPKIGFYDEKRPVITVDFNSLYPSIMRAHNLSCDTVVSPLDVASFDPKDLYESPMGYHFVRRHVHEGIMPIMLKCLIDKRAELRARMKKETDPDMLSVLDGRQLAVKTMANSVYGACGARTGALFCRMVAESVTAVGRASIHKVKDFMEVPGQFGEGVRGEVVAGDTDSCFFALFDSDVPTAIALGDEVAKKINTFIDPETGTTLFPAEQKIGVEGVYCPYLSMKKKRYATSKWTALDLDKAKDRETLEKVREAGHDVYVVKGKTFIPKHLEKGTVAVRRENPTYIKRTLNEVMDVIMSNERALAKAFDGETSRRRCIELYVRRRIHDLLHGSVPMQDMYMTKNYSKPRNEYKNPKGLDHVRVVELWEAKNPVTCPRVGARVPFVYVRTQNKRDKGSDKARPPFMATADQLDYHFYYEQKLKKPLAATLLFFFTNEKLAQILNVTPTSVGANHSTHYKPAPGEKRGTASAKYLQVGKEVTARPVKRMRQGTLDSHFVC